MTNNSPVTRAYQAEAIDVRDGERAVIARINTAGIDRLNSVIDPAGIGLGNYAKNPIVLWEHGRSPQRGTLPIGKNQWIKHDKGSRSLIAKTVFSTDEFSDGIFKLYQGEFLRAFSIRALPEEMSKPTRAEISADPSLRDCEFILRKSELAEYSGTSVPGNGDCLAIAVSRGLWIPDNIRESLALDVAGQERGVDADAPHTTDGDDKESFDASKLDCKECHRNGHCPECGKPTAWLERMSCSCEGGHSYGVTQIIRCPFKEPERSAPDLPPLTGRSFAEVVASNVILIRSSYDEISREIKERCDLMEGRV